jgi:uncharacterized protein
VFLSNVNQWMSGRSFMPIERLKAAAAEPVNLIAGGAVKFLVSGKFFTIFSFLFGLGFSVQLMRAEDRGTSVVRVYVRRLAVMALIGALHIWALWYGDILHLYAILGILLLACRRRSDRTLIVCGFLLAAFAAPAVELGEAYLPRLWTSRETIMAAREADKATMTEFRARMLSVFSSGSYLEIVRNNPSVYWVLLVKPSMVGFYGGLIGRFMLGFYAGRRRLFHDVAQHRSLWRRVLGWGLLIGVLGNGISLAVNVLSLTGRISPGARLPQIIGPVANEIGLLGLAGFYVAAIVLLFQRDRWRRLLSLLAPVGQMALSNYLAESVLAIFVFYGIGFGLIGAKPVTCIAIVFGLFTLQIVWSHLWLSRFRFGPVEWLWRSLTYGKAQPMRKEAPPAPAPLPDGPVAG